MGSQTSIAYCHHTFSPWWGCFKIREGCKNCYARAFAKRCGHDCWGLDPRRMLSDAHWKEPLKWNRAAEKAVKRPRVLVSMCDPFEDLPELRESQARFVALIERTPNLDWLLWTKRPENIGPVWHRAVDCMDCRGLQLVNNVWLGVSCSTQQDVDEMIPVLLQNPATVRAVSLEPLVEAADVNDYLEKLGCYADLCDIFAPNRDCQQCPDARRLDWVIVGGESGPKRRPFEVEWAQQIHDDCKAAGVPFYMKQDAHQYPGKQGRIPDALWAVKQFPEDTLRGMEV